jgi:hypothetical protein
MSPEYKCRRVGPPPINLGVRGFGELTIGMAECKGLALVTLAKMKKWPNQLRGASEGCDKMTSFVGTLHKGSYSYMHLTKVISLHLGEFTRHVYMYTRA